MATRSLICIQKNNPDKHGVSDGDIVGVYCHWDGYPSNNGKILKDYYHTTERVEKLLSFGGMSFLGETVDTTEFYTRDKNEPFENNKPFLVGFWSTNSKRPIFEEKEEYNYIFKNGKWLCYTYSGKEIDLY